MTEEGSKSDFLSGYGQDNQFSPVQVVLQSLSTKSKLLLKTGPRRVPLSHTRPETTSPTTSSQLKSSHTKTQLQTVSNTPTRSKLTLAPSVTTTSTNVILSPEKRVVSQFSTNINSPKLLSNNKENMENIHSSHLESIISTPNRSNDHSKQKSSLVKSGMKPSKPSVTFSSPDRTPSRGRPKTAPTLTTPEKKAVKGHLTTTSTSITSTTNTFMSPTFVNENKIQVVVTPGPLLLETPTSSTKPISHSKSKSNDHGFFSHLTSPSSGITAEKLSANKAAKRAASKPMTSTNTFNIPNKKNSVPNISIRSKTAAITVVSSTTTKKMSSISSNMLSRTTRIKDLMSPTYVKSGKPDFENNIMTSDKSTGMTSVQSSGKSLHFDLSKLEMNGSSVYDIHDISGLDTPYTVGSFSTDYEGDRAMHRFQSFEGSLSPVRKVSEDQSNVFEEYETKPIKASEEVYDRIPKTMNHNRVMTTHMRILNDRHRIDEVSTQIQDDLKPSRNQAFIKPIASTTTATTTAASRTRDDKTCTARLIHRIIAACEDDKDDTIMINNSKSINKSYSAQMNFNGVSPEHRNKSLLDCDISSVDPSRCASPKSLVSNLSWTLGRETPVSFLMSESSYASFQAITDTSDSNFKTREYRTDSNRFVDNNIDETSSIIGGDGSIAILDQAMIVDDSRDEFYGNGRVRNLNEDEDDDTVQVDDQEEEEDGEEDDESIVFNGI